MLFLWSAELLSGPMVENSCCIRDSGNSKLNSIGATLFKLTAFIDDADRTIWVDPLEFAVIEDTGNSEYGVEVLLKSGASYLARGSAGDVLSAWREAVDDARAWGVRDAVDANRQSRAEARVEHERREELGERLYAWRDSSTPHDLGAITESDR